MDQARPRSLPWLPFAAVVAAQIVVVANLTMIDISIGAIVASLHTATTGVQSAIVVCSLVTAALMILAGRTQSLYGSLPMFRGGVLLLGVGMAVVALSRSVAMLIVAEAVVGAATAALAPTLVALVAAHYEGRPRALAIGALGVAGGAIALLLAGVLGAAVGWRVPFWILVALAGLVLAASLRLGKSPKQAGVRIDWLGVLLSATGILALTVGINGIASWGLLLAKDDATIDLFGLSLSLPLICVGVVLIWLFLRYQRRRTESGRAPLLPPEVLTAPGARRASVGLMITFGVSGGSWYLLPLYMQIVQGYDGRQTAVRMLPYALSVSCSALLVTRVVGRFKVGVIARTSMLLMAAGLLALGLAINNSWSRVVVIIGLVILGLGQGAVLTIASNALIGASRAELAGEAGALRGTVTNLGGAIGTALAGALLISLLAVHVSSGVASSSLPTDLKNGLKLDNVEFISNPQLEQEATKAGLSEADVQEAVRINTEARLTSLRQCFFALAGLALLGAIMVGGLRERLSASAARDEIRAVVNR